MLGTPAVGTSWGYVEAAFDYIFSMLFLWSCLASSAKAKHIPSCLYGMYMQPALIDSCNGADLHELVILHTCRCRKVTQTVAWIVVEE